MKAHFQQFSRYNRWANARLLAACAAATDDELKRPVGLFFTSVHGTLNHLLVTDRMWLGRITGIEPEAGPLDKILHDSFLDLTHARVSFDRRLDTFVNSCSEHSLAEEISFRNTSGMEFRQRLSDILTHLFNHQTHHRSQAASGLTLLGREAPSLDMIFMFRGVTAPDDAALLALAGERTV